ncbi:hypothetical protein AAZV13_07G143900 [Glycine max]
MRDEAPAINNTNVFVVLGSLKKKKDQRGPSKPNDKKDIFWAPAPLTSKSWADVDDEDDNDYYATIAPPESVWVAPIVTLNDAAAAEVYMNGYCHLSGLLPIPLHSKEKESGCNDSYDLQNEETSLRLDPKQSMWLVETMMNQLLLGVK